MTETLDPSFAIRIGSGSGTELDVGVTQFIQRVEYESADGIADMVSIQAANPDFLLSEAKVFQPGNEMSVFMGYGNDLRHIGRVRIEKLEPNWPQNAMPTLRVVGYTIDSKMMDNAPEDSRKKPGQKKKRGRLFKDAKFSEAVDARASEYDMNREIFETPDPRHNFYQKVGLSDYDFVRGISNITGYVLWVDGDEKGKWTLHFVEPGSLQTQDRKLTFKYNQGDLSSLFSFAPQLLITGATTKLKVVFKDRGKGKLVSAEFEEENNQAPDVDATVAPTEKIDADHTSGSEIKIFINDFAFEIVANKHFKTNKETLEWARQWFRRQRENFVLARGRIIGVEDVMARQVHRLEGFASGLEGDYYFTKVKHIMDSQNGYVIDFNARKVVS